MLSVMGGLWLLSGSAPLAAQGAAASATRSFSPATAVAPGTTVTVTIEAVGYGGLGAVTETLPAGFAFLSSADGVAIADAADGRERVRFTLFGAPQTVSYMVTASSVEGDHAFEGMLIDEDQASSAVGGRANVTVAATTTPDPTPDDAGDLQFDVVPDKAVKGAVVSGLKNPIGTNPLEWEPDTTATLVSIANDGVVGDFQVKETSAGSGKFQLVVVNSGAPALSVSGTQAIAVALTYDDDSTVNLTGDITKRDPLAFTNSPFIFTIPQSTSANTPIGAFGVSGGIAGEYLDGIVSGGPFEVRDSDMTLVYSGSPALEAAIYTLFLTVNGDAGMANRAIIGTVTVIVTASNQAPSAPAIFAATVPEDAVDVGIVVSPGESVGDASVGVSANDGDTLAYTLVGADGVFEISAAGMITVGSAGISDSDKTLLHLPGYGL